MKTSYQYFIKIFALILGGLLLVTNISQANTGNKPSLALNDIAVEADLTIENWMINLGDWSDVNEDIEFEPKVENWMLNTNEWVVDNESDIELEDWMLDTEDWNTYNEEELEVEDWMINLEKW